MQLNYPNTLTIVRLLLIPVYLYFFLKGEYIISGIFFSLSGLTDFLDGYLARKYNMVTDLGKILDPLADKLTLISILAVLIYTDLIPRVISVTLLIRELLVLLGSGIMYSLGKKLLSPTLLGKLSVFILYVAIAAYLLNFQFINMILLYIVIPINIISAIDYIRNGFKKL
ncbi:MAG: CDP-alcohol phosphatidyltransferase family protein [Halanaerobiales bacterium]|nr:CDP-alcohol phosphatidyltransferase family protein [Halanaerobiales bacterium]